LAQIVSDRCSGRCPAVASRRSSQKFGLVVARAHAPWFDASARGSAHLLSRSARVGRRREKERVTKVDPQTGPPEAGPAHAIAAGDGALATPSVFPAGTGPLAPPTADQEAEADILAALAGGDRDRALTILMRRYGAALYRHIAEMVGDRDLAADVHQQVFIEAHRDLDRFAGRSRCRTWLYGIAHHRCLDALKARRRRDRRFILDGGDDDGFEIDAADPTPLPSDRIDADRLGALLDACLKRLQPAARTAVLLRYQEEMPFDEIARICRERPGTLQQRVARALPLLRRCIEGRGKGAP
jgi:RNA polymerase sigma-70 factor, ECF subfamily